ncbi:MAG: primosomal protein [Minisyncoccia bacterium]
MKQVLIETIPFSVGRTQLHEGMKAPSGNPLVEGILATAEVKNGNGRYYPKELWEREIDKYQQIVKENRATGELDHPESSIINLKNVSHIIREIWWDGDKVLGKLEILPTVSGNILKALIDNNVTVGVSSRGMGSLKQIGETLEVQDDFELLCWDFVSTPSNPGSYMHLVKEGKEIPTNSYEKVNTILTEILCANGTCPIF